MVPRLRDSNSAMGSHGRSTLVCAPGNQFVRTGNRASGKIGCARRREVLVAKISRAAASESAKDTDFGYHRRGVLSCTLRSLHGEIPGAGGCSFHMDQTG